MGQPPANVQTSVPLVRTLIAEQFPQLAREPIVYHGQGWDCALYRLGEKRAVRLPVRDEPAAWLPRQMKWLRVVAPGLPLPVPVALGVGEPTADYPYSWEIVQWYPGDDAITTPPDDPMVAAMILGQFLAALAQPAPPDAPHNPYRGVPLADRDTRTRERLAELSPDDAELAQAWEAGLAAEPYAGAPVWLHGDLHPANWLICDGQPSAVIDWIDICAGDPATDLALGWYCFDHAARQQLFATAGHEGPGSATWDRARAWALSIALAIGVSDARLGPMAAFTLNQIGHDLSRR